jgi:hypothetical protein
MKKIILIILLIAAGFILGRLSMSRGGVDGEIVKDVNELNKKPIETVCDNLVQERQKTNIEEYAGNPATVNFESNPDAKLFRTAITEQVAEGANFAGHYVVSTWGCGTNCIGYAVVDVKTGDIIEYVPYHPFQTITGLGFSIDQDILVFNPKTPTDKNGYQSNGYKEERSVAEVAKEDYTAGFGRIYYDLIETDSETYLHEFCIENLYSDLVK